MRAFLIAVLSLTLLCQLVSAFAPGAPAHIHDRIQAVQAAKHIASSAAQHAAEGVGSVGSRRSITHARRDVDPSSVVPAPVAAATAPVVAAVSPVAAVASAAQAAVSSVASAAAGATNGSLQARGPNSHALLSAEVQAKKRMHTRHLAQRKVGGSKRFAKRRSSTPRAVEAILRSVVSQS
ncbi:hypothetical protein OC834_000884 [Tilletia horrida]|nr:hypothetical protein OC834_000884 [Tilletia horrida]